MDFVSVRATDPQTSQIAAAAINAAGNPRAQQAIEALKANPEGLTSYEIAKFHGVERDYFSPQMKVLARKGKVQYAGFNRINPVSGLPNMVWKLTPPGTQPIPKPKPNPKPYWHDVKKQKPQSGQMCWIRVKSLLFDGDDIFQAEYKCKRWWTSEGREFEDGYQGIITHWYPYPDVTVPPFELPKVETKPDTDETQTLLQ